MPVDSAFVELVNFYIDQLPECYQPYTDKYFLRSRSILEKSKINPEVSLKVFARGKGPIPREALAEFVAVFEKYGDEFKDNGGELYISKRKKLNSVNSWNQPEPIAIVKGRALDVIDLETMYLGVLSHHLTKAHPDYEVMDSNRFYDKVKKVADIYNEIDVPLFYFGARHYHWSKDKQLAKAALKAGAAQTSTDIGSSNIGEEGIGTTPHALTLILAGCNRFSSVANSTVTTAALFDRYMAENIPRITLVDTFNREIDDALKVCHYFDLNSDGNFSHKFRVDTCGENVAQGAKVFSPNTRKYEVGTGVKVSGVKALRDRLIEEGYGDQTDIILSSGFGNPEKARVFVDAYKQYKEETGYDLFVGIGAGGFVDGKHTTADIYAVNGESMAKKGREQGVGIIKYRQKHMEQIT